ncbi:UNVERIFIED_CONTAM: hypothetical protein IGO34_33800 [Salmonella enterica subsp. enterica serovar Weltevreden]
MKEINLNEIPEEKTIPETEHKTEPVETTEETGPSHLPNGKFLPMKKMTFAEWVELFKN